MLCPSLFLASFKSKNNPVSNYGGGNELTMAEFSLADGMKIRM